jgi:seryl-tRNA synthetase
MVALDGNRKARGEGVSEITRYWIDRADADAPYKSEDGEMVLYADYLAAVSALQDRIKELEKEAAEADEAIDALHLKFENCPHPKFTEAPLCG